MGYIRWEDVLVETAKESGKTVDVTFKALKECSDIFRQGAYLEFFFSSANRTTPYTIIQEPFNWTPFLPALMMRDARE